MPLPEPAGPETELVEEAPASCSPVILKETVSSSSSALQTFLKTYNSFISENQNVCIDMDRVMTDLNSQIKVLPPPVKYSFNSFSCPSRY